MRTKPGECYWLVDEHGTWTGTCGKSWEFSADGPAENGMRYCPCCGLRLVWLTIHKGPDAQGRYVYTRHWLDDPRTDVRLEERTEQYGQVFHASLPAGVRDGADDAR